MPAGSIKSYFKGNGTNVLKIAPETSIKLALNDKLKQHIHLDTGDITPWQRMACGGVSGAVGQVRPLLLPPPWPWPFQGPPGLSQKPLCV